MSASTVTSKGQITIPVDIRNLLNIRVGDVLEFLVEEDGKIKLYPQSKDIKELKTLLPKSKKKLTVDEMNDIIAKRGGGRIK
jgi:AbrB family looped-hinge helix DNA binding protein